MWKISHSKDLKLSLLFSALGLVASIFVVYYQISMFTENIKQAIISQLGSIQALIPIAALQGALITFIATFVGLKIARKVNLKLNFKFDKKSIVLATLIGLVTGLIIV